MTEQAHEVTAVETVLGQLVLTGHIVTMDVFLTPQHVAQATVKAAGDYVMIVKKNHNPARYQFRCRNKIRIEPPLIHT